MTQQQASSPLWATTLGASHSDWIRSKRGSIWARLLTSTGTLVVRPKVVLLKSNAEALITLRVTTRFVARNVLIPTCTDRILSCFDSIPQRAYQHPTHFDCSPQRTPRHPTSTAQSSASSDTTKWSHDSALRSSPEAPNAPLRYCQLSHVLPPIVLLLVFTPMLLYDSNYADSISFCFAY